jgi:cytochrome c oxidase subunit II
MSEQSSAGPRGRIESSLAALVFGLLAIAMVALALRGWLPPVASQHGAGVDRLLIYLLASTGALAVTGHLVLAYFIWRFSRARSVTHRLASPRMERLGSIIPALVMTVVAEGGVLAFGLPIWSEYFASSPPADSVTVEVTAEQFSWNIRYRGEDGVFGRTDPQFMDATNRIGLDPADPDGHDDIVRINRIFLPVNRPARILLRSKDVIHSFFLPNLRVKQDVVPGMDIEIWFVPTKEGQYELACTELCGLAHYYMRGTVDVLSETEFERWLRESAEEDA